MKRIFPLLLLTLSCEEPTPEALEQEVKAAVELEGDPDRRLSLLEVHVTRNPQSANAHLWLARAYRERHDPRALSEYQRASELGPTDSVSRIEVGYHLIESELRRGKDPTPKAMTEAFRWVEEGVSITPTCENRHALIGLHEIALSAGKLHPGAKPTVEASLAACAEEPAFVAQWTATLGRIVQSEGNATAAADALCSAVAQGNPEPIDACMELAGPARGCEALVAGKTRALVGAETKYSAAEAANECVVAP
jgi:hypothetical protein